MSSENSCSACYPPALREPAYGKLNLTLDVLGKRPDGYHDLRMVMCSVELHDDISVEPGAGEESCLAGADDGRPCGVDGIPQGAENLAFRAARAFFDAAGFAPDGFSIRIVKRIPAQAGMAGGSSDAAAVLRALNRHYGAFSDTELRQIGLRVGSDVPYCLFGGTALAEGRGERLTRLPSLPGGLAFVLVKPEFSVSTPALFRALDEDAAARSKEASAAMLDALERGDSAAIGKALSNDFAPVLAREYPVVAEVKQALVTHGALGSELTGTGSVIYGLFSDRTAAVLAAQALSSQYPFTAVAAAVEANPA